MDINKCEEISKVEFGSTYQGTSDEHSDRDYMILVKQPLEDVIFRNNEKASHHTEEARYYSVERFINLTLKGSYDNILLLCAQLEQAQSCSFNREVLNVFYNDMMFSSYVKSNIKTLVYSVLGQLNKLMSKTPLTGKETVKYFMFREHLEKYNSLLDDFQQTLDYKTFSKVQNIPQMSIRLKRQAVGFINAENEKHKDIIETLAKEIKGKLKDKEEEIKQEQYVMRSIESYLKAKTTNYLVNTVVF